MQIACLLDDGFEDSEFKKPYEAFKGAGYEVTIIGTEKKRVQGKNGEVAVDVEATIDEVSSVEFDVLFIPGGSSPDHLRADDLVVAFTKAFADLSRPLLTVCHGPQLLATADAIHGRQLTAWKTVQDDLLRMGENVVDQEVVVDDLLITSRQPSDLDAFIRESLAKLGAISSTTSRVGQALQAE